jgi:hypothetical protein
MLFVLLWCLILFYFGFVSWSFVLCFFVAFLEFSVAGWRSFNLALIFLSFENGDFLIFMIFSPDCVRPWNSGPFGLRSVHMILCLPMKFWCHWSEISQMVKVPSRSSVRSEIEQWRQHHLWWSLWDRYIIGLRGVCGLLGNYNSGTIWGWFYCSCAALLAHFKCSANCSLESFKCYKFELFRVYVLRRTNANP